MNPPELTDTRRVEFLLALDAAEDVEVNEWEAGFIESFLKRPDCLTASFSPKQREVIAGMMRNYLHRVPMKNVQPSKVGIFKLPAAPVGQCNYIVPGEGGELERCGATLEKDPSTQTPKEFCEDHERVRAEARARLRELKDHTRRRN